MASIHYKHPWAQLTEFICHIACSFRDLASSSASHCIISKCIDLSCMCVFDMFMLIFVFAGTPGKVTVMAVT